MLGQEAVSPSLPWATLVVVPLGRRTCYLNIQCVASTAKVNAKSFKLTDA